MNKFVPGENALNKNAAILNKFKTQATHENDKKEEKSQQPDNRAQSEERPQSVQPVIVDNSKQQQAADEQITKAVVKKRKAEQEKKTLYKTSLHLTTEQVQRAGNLRIELRPHGCLSYDKIISCGLDAIEKMTEAERVKFMGQYKK